MSSDSRPSFRTYSKKKLKNILQPNITSSLRERFVSNGTYQKIIDKSRNITNTVIDKTHLGELINKTKEKFPTLPSSEENSTIPKGFFDSLFSPQTANDVYFKTVIISLWVIAILCILSTMITMFIPVAKNRGKTAGVKMIFFHIFLCELCYLIYILLSMINVGLDFQLTSFWCNTAKYGMYATVPIMYVALLVLSFERITSRCKSGTCGPKMFTNTWIVQSILIFSWIIGILIISVFVYIKERAKESSKELFGKIVPTRFGPSADKIFSFGRCSIDGQLLPLFKILFVVLFVILIVLIVKSTAFTIAYTFFTPSCCQAKKKIKSTSDHMTLIFIVILVSNLVLSFPFYFISTADSIKNTIFGDKPFSIKLKISFILRLSSIIIQCLVFYIMEANSWCVLSKLIHYISCKKTAILDSKTTDKTKPRRTIKSRSPSESENEEESDGHETKTDKHKNQVNSEVSTTDESDDDEVFLPDSKKEPLSAKKSKTTESTAADPDDSDDESSVSSTRQLPTKTKDVTSRSLQKRDEVVKENLPFKEKTIKSTTTNGMSKPTSNGKVSSQRITSAPITDPKTPKSNTAASPHKYTSILADSSTDDVSNASVHSDDEVKPTPTKPKILSVVRSSSNKQNHSPTMPVNRQQSHDQPHRTTRPQVSRPIARTSSNHRSTKTATHRRKSPRNTHNHTKKPKRDHLNRIYDQSVEV